jgi:hypothetical protein
MEVALPEDDTVVTPLPGLADRITDAVLEDRRQRASLLDPGAWKRIELPSIPPGAGVEVRMGPTIQLRPPTPEEARHAALELAIERLHCGLFSGSAEDLSRNAWLVRNAVDEHGCEAAALALAGMSAKRARSHLAVHLAIALLTAALEAPLDLVDVETVVSLFVDRVGLRNDGVIVRVSPEDLAERARKAGL